MRPDRRSIVPIAPGSIRLAAWAAEANERWRISRLPRLVFGSGDELEEALGESGASSTVNTSFVERQNTTDRHRNARKGKTYRFSRDW